MLRHIRRAAVPAAAAFAFTVSLAGLPASQSRADDASSAADATYKEIEQLMGGVPSFVKAFPKAGVAGAWAEVRDLQFSDKTALPAKTKALISLAVAAQIPCQYCIWSDTRDAKAAGASDEEVAEAVAIAALTRHWSTVFNGLQIDFDTYKMEMGGDVAAK